jgi:S-adenosyl-L-methionine hydrolase (adenosine-forming)
MNPSSHPPLGVLLTDFPLADPYVGVMKGVVLSRVPGATLVDLAHGLPAGDIVWAALVLQEQAEYFPPRTVFLAVVDPGVGTERRILAARAGDRFFVGPDNGLLFPALTSDARGVPRNPEMVAVDRARVRLPSSSETFHGRDIMAPAVAHLLGGRSLDSLGSRIIDPVRLALSEACRVGEIWTGEVLAADGFGNLITSIRTRDLAGGGWRIFLGDQEIGPVQPAFGGVPTGSAMAIAGSLNRIEIAVRDGSARRRFEVEAGAQVVARRLS